MPQVQVPIHNTCSVNSTQMEGIKEMLDRLEKEHNCAAFVICRIENSFELDENVINDRTSFQTYMGGARRSAQQIYDRRDARALNRQPWRESSILDNDPFMFFRPQGSSQISTLPLRDDNYRIIAFSAAANPGKKVAIWVQHEAYLRHLIETVPEGNLVPFLSAVVLSDQSLI